MRIDDKNLNNEYPEFILTNECIENIKDLMAIHEGLEKIVEKY